MESQAHHPAVHTHTYDQDPHNVGLHSVVQDEGVHHDHDHEKTSVLKKVKDKAKKIKHKLHLDGHGHEHDEHGNKLDARRGGYEEDDDEEDEDEEMVQDPEIHGAPMYESSAIRSSIPEQTRTQAPASFGNPTPVTELRPEYPKTPATSIIRSSIPEQTQTQAPAGFGNPTPVAELRPEYPKTPATSMKTTNPGHHGGDAPPQIGDLVPLQEDPHSPNPAGRVSPPNYESKVSDPTGEHGKAADISPSLMSSLDKMAGSGQNPTGKASEVDPSLISSLDKMTISDQNTTGSHDQFAPECVPASQASYAQKMTIAPSMIADKAISMKNAVASKLGYGDTQSTQGPGASASEYVQKVAATVTGTLAPVYEKVADAGSSVVSKVRGGGGATGGDVAVGPDKGVPVTGATGGDVATRPDKGVFATGATGGDVVARPDKGVSVTGYLAEKLRPGEDDKALSDMISDKLQLSKEAHPTPVGRVTESEEVRRDLGTGMKNKSEGDDAIAAGKEYTGGNGGGGVIEQLKGAVTSWMGKQAERGSGTMESPSQVKNEGEVGEKTEERRLQGSGN